MPLLAYQICHWARLCNICLYIQYYYWNECVHMSRTLRKKIKDTVSVLSLFMTLSFCAKRMFNIRILVNARVTLSPDGHTIKEMFILGPGRKHIRPFVKAIEWPPMKFLRLRQQLRERWQNCWRISFWIRVSILPFVRPPWGQLVKLCHLRLNFVWSSVPSSIFRLTKTIRRKQEAARLSSKVNNITWSSSNAFV